jgi:hypothetical protein
MMFAIQKCWVKNQLPHSQEDMKTYGGLDKLHLNIVQKESDDAFRRENTQQILNFQLFIEFSIF